MGVKEPLRKVLVFGAAGHIGGPAVAVIRRDAPEIGLRLTTHRPEAAAALAVRFPDAEVVEADYFDLPALLHAFERSTAASP